jgi:hypothetical protein
MTTEQSLQFDPITCSNAFVKASRRGPPLTLQECNVLAKVLADEVFCQLMHHKSRRLATQFFQRCLLHCLQWNLKLRKTLILDCFSKLLTCTINIKWKKITESIVLTLFPCSDVITSSYFIPLCLFTFLFLVLLGHVLATVSKHAVPLDHSNEGHSPVNDVATSPLNDINDEPILSSAPVQHRKHWHHVPVCINFVIAYKEIFFFVCSLL